MAIWIKGDQVGRMHGELLEAQRRGEEFVVHEKEVFELRADEMIVAKDRHGADLLVRQFENGEVSEVNILLIQLNAAMDRGYGDWLVLPDFAEMGLDTGTIFSDLKKMGLKEPLLEEMIYEKMEDNWAEIALNREWMEWM